MKLVALAQSYERASPTLTDPAAKSTFPMLVHHAEWALRAGVQLTWDDYLQLDQLERMAFVRAGDTMRAQQAQQVGVAASSLIGAAATTAEFDDGDALEMLALDAIHAQALAEASA